MYLNFQYDVTGKGLRSECMSSKGLVAHLSFSGKAQLGILPRAHRANTILSWKVDILEMLCMFVCTLEDFLQGVPKSPVHNVIINFAHGGNIVRSNCGDRSNPKNNATLIFWICTKP